jgi:hypothetical protein
MKESTSVVNQSNGITAQEFTNVLFKLFDIPYDEGAIGYEAHRHLTNIFNTNINNLFNVIDSKHLKIAIWKLVLTDVNLLIFKEKHCDPANEATYLGPEFCEYWNSTFRLSLTKVQLYSIIIKIGQIKPNTPPTEIISTLLKLFRNKLESINEVNNERLFAQGPSTATDLTKFAQSPVLAIEAPPRVLANNAPPRVLAIEAPPPAAAAIKYLKYKNKYTALKNKINY